MERELILNENINTNIIKKLKNEFRLDGKNFFLTYPQCTLTRVQVYDEIATKVDIDYICVAQEFHESGDPHIHVFLTTKKKKGFKNPFCFDVSGFHGNYQVARDSNKAHDYVMKSDLHPHVVGIYIGNDRKVVRELAEKNKMILTHPLPELVNSGHLSLYNYKKIKEAKEAYELDSIAVPEYMPKKCLWITGLTGTGKSRWVRDTYPGLFYNKPMNKWWDGYKGEKVVLIDDFDLKGECLGHHLKIWADCYSFNAEVKGSTVRPVLDTFIITSQYTPKDIWCPTEDQKRWDEQMRAAIERRFQLCSIGDGELFNMNWD